MMNDADAPTPSENRLRLLFFGDVMGEPGRKAVLEWLPKLKEELAADFVVVNAENAAAGRGITPKIAISLLRAGAAVITSGDHIWDQKEIVPYLADEPRLLRPLNYPAGVPGSGAIVLETAKGKVAVVNALGRVFMGPQVDNPFPMLAEKAEELRAETPVILVDFHAEATSEKMAMGWHLDGKVSALIGTHTHVPTADERVLPGGTAFLCDAGMCGPVDSVIGSRIEPVVERFLNAMPARFGVANGLVRVNAVLVEVAAATGKAVSIQRVTRDWRNAGEA